MATYDVTCPNKDCENHERVAEIRKGMNDPFPECPSCGTQVVNAFLKAGNFTLKGKGWCGKSRR